MNWVPAGLNLFVFCLLIGGFVANHTYIGAGLAGFSLGTAVVFFVLALKDA